MDVLCVSYETLWHFINTVMRHDYRDYIDKMLRWTWKCAPLVLCIYIYIEIIIQKLQYKLRYNMNEISKCITHVIYLHKISVNFQVGTFASYCIRCRLKVGFKIQYISRQLQKNLNNNTSVPLLLTKISSILRKYSSSKIDSREAKPVILLCIIHTFIC